MADFGSLGAFAAHVTALIASVDHAEHEALEQGAKVVETESKRVIGTYDYGWPELAQATKAERQRLGFTPNDPLLRTGKLRDSISHTVGHREAHIGSNEDVAVWQEMGTGRIPPRSFLMGAATHKEAEVVDILGKGAVKGLLVKP